MNRNRSSSNKQIAGFSQRIEKVYVGNRFKPADLAAKVVKVGPTKAKEMLTQNTSNFRRRDLNRVAYYAELMSDGRWYPAIGTVHFGQGGVLRNGHEHIVLQNGQHVLEAIIKSNTTQYLTMITGLPKGAIMAVDTGQKRTAAQFLTYYGITDALNKACVVRRLQMWWQHQKFWNYSMFMSPDQILDVALRIDAQLTLSLTCGRKTTKELGRQGLLATHGNVVTVYYILSTEAAAPNKVDSFFESVRCDHDHVAGIAELRAWLRKRKTMLAKHNATTGGPEEIAAWFVAWNRFCTGQNVNAPLTFRVDGNNFPKPVSQG